MRCVCTYDRLPFEYEPCACEVFIWMYRFDLDILSRGPLWEMGIDYKCGTGHGVGYVLNVHEGPNGFRWRVVPERHDNGVLEEGMITTDEPGVI